MLDRLRVVVFSGIAGLVGLAVAGFVALISVIRFMNVFIVPRGAPYSATILLWIVLSGGLWVWVAHTRFGELKLGRLGTGIMVAATFVMTAETYLMSWLNQVIYRPISQMDLREFGAASAVPYAQGVTEVIGLLIFAGLIFIMWEIGHAPNFWHGFYTWRYSGFAAFGIKKQSGSLDILVCIDEETHKPVYIPERDLATNVSVQGPTGAGKSKSLLIPITSQILLHIGAGLAIVEPKGNFVSDGYVLAKRAGKSPCWFIDPANPDTDILNPLEGDDYSLIASTNIEVLRMLAGRQEVVFFADNQAVVGTNVILLLKYLFHNDVDYYDFDKALLDTKWTEGLVKRLRSSLNPEEMANEKHPKNRLVTWFTKEMFGENAEEVRKFSLGLRNQVQKLLANEYFSRCIGGKSTVNLDQLFAEGGFLGVSTNDGLLGEHLSSVLGVLMIGFLKTAAQRRPLPKKGMSLPLVPIILDEFGGYISEQFATTISKLREFNAPSILSFQNLGMLEKYGGKTFRDTLIAQCRSRIWFGDIPVEDAKWYSELTGKEDREDISTSSGTSSGVNRWFLADSYREQESRRMVEKPRFSYTEILDAPANTVFYRVMQNRTATRTRKGLVDMFDRDESFVGNALWFDREEFEKRLAERGDKPKLWDRILNFSGKARELIKPKESAAEGQGKFGALMESLGIERLTPARSEDNEFINVEQLKRLEKAITKPPVVEQQNIEPQSDESEQKPDPKAIWISSEAGIEEVEEVKAQQPPDGNGENIDIPVGNGENVETAATSEKETTVSPYAQLKAELSHKWAESADDLDL